MKKEYIYIYIKLRSTNCLLTSLNRMPWQFFYFKKRIRRHRQHLNIFLNLTLMDQNIRFLVFLKK